MAEEKRSDEELLAQLEAELKRVKVSDLLVQTMYTVSSLGYRRLTEEERDLEQARVAIEALRALVPIVGGSLPEETTRDFNQVIANMQLAYASAAREEEKDEPEEPGEPSDGDA